MHNVAVCQTSVSQIETFTLASPNDGVTSAGELLVGVVGSASGDGHLDAIGGRASRYGKTFAVDLPGVARASPGLSSSAGAVLDGNRRAFSGASSQALRVASAGVDDLTSGGRARCSRRRRRGCSRGRGRDGGTVKEDGCTGKTCDGSTAGCAGGGGLVASPGAVLGLWGSNGSIWLDVETLSEGNHGVSGVLEEGDGERNDIGAGGLDGLVVEDEHVADMRVDSALVYVLAESNGCAICIFSILIPNSHALVALEGYLQDIVVVATEWGTHETGLDTEDTTESLFHSVHTVLDLGSGESCEIGVRPSVISNHHTMVVSILDTGDHVSVVDTAIVVPVEEEGPLDLVLYEQVNELLMVDVRTVIEGERNLLGVNARCIDSSHASSLLWERRGSGHQGGSQEGDQTSGEHK